MKRFDENELEIAVLTRNRSEILGEFLKKQIAQFEEINASLVIYDTSADDKTEILVRAYQKHGYKIKYSHADFNKTIDEKYLDAIIGSSSKYLWIMGDSTYMDIPSFVKKAFNLVKESYELIVVWDNSVREAEYHDVQMLFSDCLWFMTWLGGPIFRKDIYKDIVTEDKKNSILDLSNSKNGSWYTSLGILMEALLRVEKPKAKVISVNKYALTSIEKKQAWVSDAYKIWCKDLCLLVDCFGEQFHEAGDKALKTTWSVLNLDKNYWSCRFRAENSLNGQLYEEYDKKGFIDRVSHNKKNIRKWAYAPRLVAVITYKVYKVYHIFRAKLRKLIKGY